MCSWYYIGNSGNHYVYDTVLGTVETVVFMVVHWEQWKRLCSWYYVGNSGNVCVHGSTLGTVETKCVHGIILGMSVKTVMFMVLQWEQWKRLC